MRSRKPATSRKGKAVKIAAVATAHVGVLHYFLHFLDFVATWRVITEITHGLSEHVAAFPVLAFAVLPLAAVSLAVWIFCDHHDRKRQHADADADLDGLHS